MLWFIFTEFGIAVRFLYGACVFVEANLWLRIKKRVL